jgi:hypothetical protein
MTGTNHKVKKVKFGIGIDIWMDNLIG